MMKANFHLGACGALLLALFTPSWSLGAPITSCLIEPYSRITLRSAVTALITDVHVDRGSTVRKGQLLVTLDAGVEQAALESARLRAKAESAVQAAQARLAHAKLRLARREDLAQKGFISHQDRDDAEAEQRVNSAAVQEAEEARQIARVEAQRFAAEVQRRTIVSPIDGVVTERLQQRGELATAGETSIPILKLAQTDPLRVELVMPLAKFGKVRVGDRLTVHPEMPASASYRAVVKVVDSVIDASSGTFGVRLEIPNPKNNLLAGVKCTVDL
jgi:RND family efflux transporter MFP subunit